MTAPLQSLRTYLRHNAPRLRSSPCLLITSSSPPAASTAVAGTRTPSSISSDTPDERRAKAQQLKLQQHQHHPGVSSFVGRNVQSLTLEYNVRTVSCTISSAFPTVEKVDEAISLARRAGLRAGGGEGTVVGIGSGAAMDLARAVADSLFGDNDDNDDADGGSDDGSLLVLAPCTLGALWAATSTSDCAPSLLLDTKEEMLLPHSASSWRRRGASVVTLDPTRQLAMPPLYTPFRPVRRNSGGSSPPTMAHVAAAALAVLLDAARSADAAMVSSGSTGHSVVAKEMQAVATSCADVLLLASREAKNNDGGGSEGDDDGANEMLAQRLLLDAIPRLSPLVRECSLLSNDAPFPATTTGMGTTIPQRLANALLPAYFPQCHLVTYLACTLPGLCDALSDAAGGPSTHDGGGETSMFEGVARAIIGGDSSGDISSLLPSWASRVATEAGVPSMASVAYGTPDLSALVGSLDAYDALIASSSSNMAGVAANNGGDDDHWIVEDVLQRSLNR